MNSASGENTSVLVISTGIDQSTDEVIARLEVRGIQYCRLDTETFPFKASLTARFMSTDPFALTLDGGTEIQGARSVWYRRVRTPVRHQEMNPGVHEFCLREARAALLGSVLAMDCPMMSRPEAVWAAENKPLQLKVASDLGLEIPQTVITNDPEQVRDAFRVFRRAMIAKPVRTGYVDLGDEQLSIFTNSVLEEHLNDTHSLSISPVIYQQHIKKASDVRVTIVGTRIFAAEIDSQSDPEAVVDWRKTVNPDLGHRRIELPEVICDMLHRLMRRLGLHFGAIDFVRTPDDRYVFLEINPNGQWLWLDDMLGLGITDAVADWLAREKV